MNDYFFVVGAQRSSTTYLYQALDEHPEIEMAKPMRPEPKFFHVDTLFEKGLDFYQSQFFSAESNARIRGEKSTVYIESEKAARRIANCYPQTKIIMIFRNPIERAISHYWFSKNNGWETLSIEEAFLQEDARWLDFDSAKVSGSPYAYLHRGIYIDYLLMYEHYFPVENIKVILYEQLVGSKEKFLELYSFLGVSAYTPSTLHTIINEGDKPGRPLSPELRQYLADYFAEPNARLAEHLNISLCEWQ